MPQESRQYCAFTVAQRAAPAPRVCLLYAPVKEVLEWALIAPLGPANRAGVQRQTVDSRVKGIQRYFNMDPRNIIPTSIVIAFSPDTVQVTDVALAPGQAACAGISRVTVTWNSDLKDGSRTSRPGYVIDGQHRLKGIERFNADTLIPIVAILEADNDETAFQFLVINNKASKVPTDHVRALLTLKADEAQLEERLKSARLSLNQNYESVGFADSDDDSPFRGLIKWPLNQNGYVVPTAIEISIENIRRHGAKTDLSEPEPAQAFFRAIWTVIHAKWGDIWNPDSKLLSKVAIICLTEFFTMNLMIWARHPKSELDITNEDDVKENAEGILESLDPQFFTADWASSSYDTGAGRQQIRDAIEAMYKNITAGEPWYEGVTVIDPNWLTEHTSQGKLL